MSEAIAAIEEALRNAESEVEDAARAVEKACAELHAYILATDDECATQTGLADERLWVIEQAVEALASEPPDVAGALEALRDALEPADGDGGG